MGRRKIEMKLVRDSSSRQVTFSKRRSGLFKKANELATLCGAEVAIVAFSPGGKPFSFGQPSFDVLADRFLNHGSSKRSQNGSHGGSSSTKSDAMNMTMEKLNQQLMNLMKESNVEKKKGKMLDKTLKKDKLTKGKLPMEGLDLAELQELKDSLEELHHDVMQHQKETEARSCLMLLAENAVKERENYDA